MARQPAPKKHVITAEVVTAECERGLRRLAAPRGTAVITPAAWSKAQELGVTFDQSADAQPASITTDTANGHCERLIDASGVVTVRGRSVKLGRFEAAGPDRNVGLLDVVTGKDRSPMTAGFMSFGRADAFAWRLDYDEIDYVLEGTLHLTVEGRVIEGKSGDVLYVPKGTSLVFGTPSRTRVFYVTYPADWAQAASAPGRASQR